MTGPLVALTVAGTDSGGAAGVAADLTTFAALGAHGACAVTAVTAQDTTGVHHVVQLSADDVRGPARRGARRPAGRCREDRHARQRPSIASVVADLPAALPLVVDPVLVATSGAALGDESVVAAYRDRAAAARHGRHPQPR